MSEIILTTDAITPALPSAGDIVIYTNSTGNLCSVDSAGTVIVYAAGVTQEQVEDYVGALIQASSSVQPTYNDAAASLTLAVIPAGVDHNSLANLTTGNPHTQYLQTSVASSTYQPLDGDLTALSALAGTGVIVRTAANTATTRTIAAGTGVTLSNGDGVSGNPTVSLSAVGTAGTFGSASSVPVITTNAQGQVSSVTPTTISITSAAVSDFSEAVDDRVAALVVAGTGITATYNDPANTLTLATTITQYTDEQAQDAVGNILTDSVSVDFTYNDAGNTITAAVLPAGVNHNALQNYVANQHVDHSTVSIIAGTGLSGGGDLTTSRTLNLANTAVTAGSYGTATTIPAVTVNAQGQITGVVNNLVAIPSTQVTDFNEAAQDAVGGILTDSPSVDFTYNDVGNSIQASVLPGGVDHNGLANLTTGNPHTQYLLSATAATTYQPLDSDLTAMAALAGTGFITRSGAGTAAVRTIVSGTGMSVTNGDGISGNPTITLANTAVTAGSYGNNANSPQLVVNAQGQITSIANSPISISSLSVTDFSEAVDDRVAALVVAGSGISVTYNDPANTLTIAATVGGGTVTSVGTGTGLTGGTITGSGTISLANTAVTASSYGSASQVGTFTVNAQGQLTAAASTNIAITSAAVSDFTEAAQDAIAASFINSPDIVYAYTDASNQMNVDLTTTGLTAGTYGGVNAIPVITADNKGRTSAITTVNTTSALLTGLSLASDADIVATDTILAALGKLQAMSNRWTELRNTTVLTNNSNVTLTNVTNLGFQATAGLFYRIECHIRFQSAATGTGIALTFGTSNGATGTIAGSVDIPIAADGTGAIYSGAITSLGDLVIGTAVTTANTDYLTVVVASFTCTGSGIIVPQFRSEVNGSTVTVGVGSTILVREFT
jgi:trimeric autotransporter adhesin